MKQAPFLVAEASGAAAISAAKPPACRYTRRMRRFVLALILLAAASPCGAQTIRGVGARPCAEWVQARGDNGRDFEAEQWALGYLSGANAATKTGALFRATDEKAIFTTIDAYCGAHPQDMLWNAVKSVLVMPHGA